MNESQLTKSRLDLEAAPPYPPLGGHGAAAQTKYEETLARDGERRRDSREFCAEIGGRWAGRKTRETRSAAALESASASPGVERGSVGETNRGYP